MRNRNPLRRAQPVVYSTPMVVGSQPAVVVREKENQPERKKKDLKKVLKKKVMNSGEFMKSIMNDVTRSYSRVVNDSAVTVFIILACVLVFTHPNGIHSGPIGKLLKKYPDHPVLNFVEEQFAKLLALTIFVPVWFAVPSDGLIVSVIASVFWVLISDATIVANFILSTLLFTFLSVKLFRTKMFLIIIGAIIYVVVYSGASVSVTIDKPATKPPRTQYVRDKQDEPNEEELKPEDTYNRPVYVPPPRLIVPPPVVPPPVTEMRVAPPPVPEFPRVAPPSVEVRVTPPSVPEPVRVARPPAPEVRVAPPVVNAVPPVVNRNRPVVG